MMLPLCLQSVRRVFVAQRTHNKWKVKHCVSDSKNRENLSHKREARQKNLILDFLEHLGVFGYARACFLVEIELGFGVAKRFGLHFLVFPLLFHSLLLFMFVLMYILMDFLNMSG